MRFKNCFPEWCITVGVLCVDNCTVPNEKFCNFDCVALYCEMQGSPTCIITGGDFSPASKQCSHSIELAVSGGIM